LKTCCFCHFETLVLLQAIRNEMNLSEREKLIERFEMLGVPSTYFQIYISLTWMLKYPKESWILKVKKLKWTFFSVSRILLFPMVIDQISHKMSEKWQTLPPELESIMSKSRGLSFTRWSNFKNYGSRK